MGWKSPLNSPPFWYRICFFVQRPNKQVWESGSVWAILIRDFPPEINCSWISAEQNHRTTGNIVGFLRGYWGNLRIPREDCGNLKGAMGKIREKFHAGGCHVGFRGLITRWRWRPFGALSQPTNQPTIRLVQKWDDIWFLFLATKGLRVDGHLFPVGQRSFSMEVNSCFWLP